MPLDRLKITNFQAHESLRVDLSSGLTTIVGPSDVGKSAILRALRWLCLNTPQGDAFIRDGAKVAEAVLTFDGHTLTRKRDKGGDNVYTLDGTEFRAFGVTVPEAIAAALGVNGLNFVGQHQSPFWFTETAGEVSRQLNAVVDLGIIDETLGNIGRRVRECQEDIRVSTDRLTKTQADKEGLAWADEAGQTFAKLENRHRQLAEIRARRMSLAPLVKWIDEAQQARDAAVAEREAVVCVGRLGAAVRTASGRVGVLGTLLANVDQQAALVARGYPDVARLTELKEVWSGVREKRTKLQAVAQAIRDAAAVVGQGAPDIGPVAAVVAQAQATTTRRQRLAQLLHEIRSAESSVSSWRAQAAAAKRDLERETGGRCPVCGKEITI